MADQPYKLHAILNRNYKPVKFRIQGKPHYQIFLELTSETDANLENVKQVEYILHPSFKERNRISTDRENAFKIQIKAWGVFHVRMLITLTSGKVIDTTQHMNEHWEEKHL